MRLYLQRIILFFCFSLLVYVLVYKALDFYFNSAFTEKASVFVWGDSQVKYGVDIPLLSKKIDRNVYTSANNGNGVYDFLVFAGNVPDSSTVLISISKLAQVRRKEMDYNRSGLSFGALNALVSAGYDFREAFEILMNNVRPKKACHYSAKLKPWGAEMVPLEPLSAFENYFSKVPDFLRSKQTLMFEGIKQLRSKGCYLNFLDLPFHPILSEVERSSPINKDLQDFIAQIKDCFGSELKVDSIKLEASENIFSDLSHLNALGAQEVSRNLNFTDTTTFFVFR